MTILGGSMFRMAISAVPFLLPLLFQVGFGWDAFHSGLLVLAVFAGNLLMKPGTTPILRKWGFRNVLVVNGIVNVVMLAACATLSPTTPVVVIVAILFIGGAARSMQFTAINTLAFADVAESQMSSANTSFNTVTQISMGLGIALGAIALRASRLLVSPLRFAAEDHRLAFVLVSGVALLGVLDSLFLEKNAGELVSGGKR